MAKRDLKGERVKEFLAEAEEILNTMGKGLLKLGKGVKAGVIDPLVLNGIFRSAHTLKGMSGIFDFKDMADLSHALEDALDMMRLGRVSLTEDVLDAVMAAHELLLRIVASKGKTDFSKDIGELKKRLSVQPQQRKPPKGKESIGREYLSVLTEYEDHRLRENIKEGRNILVVNARFPITNFDRGYLALTELLKTEAEVIATLPSNKSNHETLSFDILVGTARDKDFISRLVASYEAEVRALSEPSGRAPQPSAVAQGGPFPVAATEAHPGRPGAEGSGETLRRVGNTVRVNIGKLDGIMNTISELGMLKANIARLAAELRNERAISVYGIELSRNEKLLEKKLAELRDGVLDVRMVPIGQLFSRFDTFLDRLSRETGKEIRMETYGDETELDKLIVEELADPLMHIIRNVADHAIEPPSARESLGKPPAGTITLGAYQKGNHVIVEVKDDGAGIDVELLKKKALERGLAEGSFLEGLSPQDALDLIFLPGLSTRDSVSETSGRGVGMDVVKENITRLSGIIDVESVKGEGTRFLLTIPVTLAIIQALIVEAGGRRYAVPLNSVLEVLELGPEAAAAAAGAEEQIKVNERNIPVVMLSAFFGNGAHGGRNACYGIVAGLAEHRVCVIVDALVEELDVVIKPLPRILKVPGVAGATDMGEKGTLLVLDVTGILETALREKKAGLTSMKGLSRAQG